MPSSTRAIDKLSTPPPNQSQKLQVIVVGAPRSGTTSLGTALKILGYDTCVGVAHSYLVENHFPYWREAIDAKYHGLGTPYTAEDYDKFLGKYEALTGWGAALLAEELMEAFPEAKVICTGRDGDKWVESFNNSIVYTYLWWRKWHWILPLCGGKEQQFVQFKNTAIHAWSYGNPLDKDEQKKYYLDHNQRISKIVPKEKLLVFNPEDGWVPLCNFLGKEVPMESYPRTAGRSGFHRDMAMIWRRALLRAARNVGIGAMVTFLLAIAIRKYWQRDSLFYRLRSFLRGS